MESETRQIYIEKICPVQQDFLLKENDLAVRNFVEFCSNRQLLPLIDFNKKQLHLFGCPKSIKEAENRFFELQNELLIENVKRRKIDGILWWYERWDGTWQQYSSTLTNDIEKHFKTNVKNISLNNDIGERILIDFIKWEEIYGTRIKRIRRLKVDELQPIYWKLTPLDVERILLDKDSNEYVDIKENFDKTMKGSYTNMMKIERIQNRQLFRQFSILHEEYVIKYGRNDNGTMRFLYHGCPERAIENIIQRGFNRSYCGVNGCVYGRGVYFSTRASYSNGYAEANDKHEKHMFYSRVLIGRTTIGNSSMREPENGYDTTTDGNHIFVCYYDWQCYPEYLMTYIEYK